MGYYSFRGGVLTAKSITCVDLVVTGTATNGSWSPVNAVNLTQNFSVGTTLFTVAVATGNTVVGGTFTATGASTLTGAVTCSSTLAVTSTSAFTGAATFAGAVDVAGAFTVATNKLAVAAATGIITMHEGATIDNDTGTNTLTLTETNIALVGITGITGATTITGTLALTGTITMANGATIANASATAFVITETSIALVGAVELTGNVTVATSVLAINGTTGVITMKGGATIDNNASATVLALAETNITLTGIVGITGATTITGATAVVGTLTIGTTGTTLAFLADVFTVTEASILLVGTVDVSSTFTVATNKLSVHATTGTMTLANSATIANASAGVVTITAATTIAFATANVTCVSLDVGGGSGGSGVTITTLGAITADAAIISGTYLQAATYLKLTPTAEPPGGAAEGMIYMDTDHTLLCHNGTAWKVITFTA